MRLFNVRLPDDLRADVEKAAEIAGASSTSDWARDALEAAARREFAEAERVEHSRDTEKVLGFVVTREFGSCVHPKTAYRQTAEAVVCGLCMTVVRWKL